MREALNTIADMLRAGSDALTFDWPALRFQHTAAVRSQLAGRYSAATANKMLSALRGVLKAAWRLGLMSADDYTRAADLASVTGSTLLRGRALDSGEIAALLDTCANDSTAAGVRDGAMIALLRAGGLRRAEVVTLTLADIEIEAGKTALVIHGKRNKDRKIPIGNGTLDALGDWLAVRGDAPGPIFTPINKGGKVILRAMHSEAVFNMLVKRAAEADVTEFSPHDMRRTFAGDLLDAGADIATVAKLMGHANVTTTARYDRRGEAAKRKAVELLHVPYHKRLT